VQFFVAVSCSLYSSSVSVGADGSVELVLYGTGALSGAKAVLMCVVSFLLHFDHAKIA
jgi:hypothetical protein